MTTIIKNAKTGNATVHTSLDFAREARFHVKKLDNCKFIGFHLSVQEGGPVQLVADFQQPNGLRGQLTIAV